MTALATIETERLLLKPTDESDDQFFFELKNSPTWIEFIGDHNIRCLDDAKDFIRNKVIPQREQKGFSNYTVIVKANMNKVGSCGLYDREGLDGVDLGFAFLQKFHRRGYAFEAARKVMQLALEEFQLTELSAITSEENLPSQGLLRKLGFEFSEKIILPNEDSTSLLFKIDLK